MKPYSYGLSILLLLPGLVHAQPVEEWTGLGYRFGGRAIIEATDAAGNEVPELTGTFVTGLPDWPTFWLIDSLGYCPANGGHGPFELELVQDSGPEQTPGGEGCTKHLPILSDLAGKAALIRRGVCEFMNKMFNAEQEGALATVVYNDERVFETPEPDVTEIIGMLGATGTPVEDPGVFLSYPLGQGLAELLAVGGSVEVVLTISDSVYSSVTSLGPDGVPCTPELCDGEEAEAEPVLGSCPPVVANEEEAQPQLNRLTAAHPNPFAARTRFGLTLAEAQEVEVAVYDVLGQEVARLHEGALAPGVEHALTFDGQGLPSGVYLVRAVGEAFADTRRVVLVR